MSASSQTALLTEPKTGYDPLQDRKLLRNPIVRNVSKFMYHLSFRRAWKPESQVFAEEPLRQDNRGDKSEAELRRKPELKASQKRKEVDGRKKKANANF